MDVTTTAAWRDEAWRDVATGWVDGQLDRLGQRRTEPIDEVRVRPWSRVWRVPTTSGLMWFKANGGETTYEAALVDALARWVPERVLAPLAVDAERSWFLMPDGGAILRTTPAATDPRQWEVFVSEYAQLQKDLQPRVPDLLALGVPDHRPELLPAQAAALVDDAAMFGIEPADRERVRALLPEYADACAALAASGLSASLNHDDLHDANVLVRDNGFAFFDWGDASVSHPFATMLVTLRVVAYTFKVEPTDPTVSRVRDAYLEVFGDGRDLAELRELARLAAWTDMVGRAYSWRRAIADADPAGLSEFAESVGGWLSELTEPMSR